MDASITGILFICAILISSLSDASHTSLPAKSRVIETSSGKHLSLNELADKLASADIVVLGEKHNSEDVQRASAEIIRAVIQERRDGGRPIEFATAWEFLDFTSQRRIRNAFNSFKKEQIEGNELLERISDAPLGTTYLPIMDATKELGGDLVGVNLPRGEKSAVVEQGLKGVDPELIPPGFELSHGEYFERFKGAMNHHVRSGSIENYFIAQWLTDDIIAYRLLEETDAPFRFLVIGSFHVDYGQGTVERLRVRAPDKKVVVVRFMDSEQVSSQKDAPLAEYVVIAGPPKDRT